MKTFNTYKDVTFGTNLIDQAAKQVDFLREVDKSPTLYSPPVLAQALYRYEKFWIPLAAEHKDECLSAPIDIEWVWHCHMLRPRKYISDCKALVGSVINHKLKTLNEYESDKKKSKILWENKYPDVPFDVDITRKMHGSAELGFESKIAYDVIAAAGRQKEFFYNVSLPHYKDPKFLQQGKDRYQKMLYLKQEAPNQYLVPCYDNDVIWHTHQLNPWDYEKDMMRYFGEVFDHDDSTNDRSEGSKLTNSFVETKVLWTENFNENLAQPGAMYRGKPPSGILYKMSQAEVHCLATKKTSVSVDLVLKLENKYEGKFFIISNGYGGSKKLVTFHTSELVPYYSEMKFKTQQFDFDTRYTNCIKFEIMNYNRSVVQIEKASLNLIPFVENVNTRSKDSFERTEQLGVEGKLEIKGTFSAPEQGNVLLFIEKGAYEPGTIPENIREEWGPVGVDKLMPNMENKCIVATHK